MSKFVIECSRCGSYVEGKTGFFGLFAQKEITCACGCKINVQANKMASRACSHCGNTVVYDQTKSENAICPVCHEKLLTQDSMNQLVEFNCPSCSCKLSADKNTEKEYTCPLCDTKIDVQKQIAAEKVKSKGLASLIKYEGDNETFVWKHPIEDFNAGTQLIVHESQEAVFFKDGKALDLFGAGRYTLATQNLPVLQEVYKLPFNADTVFHSEIYFINMTTQMGIKWGTNSKVRLFDPASGLHVEIGASGRFNIRVIDSRKLLLKVVGTTRGLTQAEAFADENDGKDENGKNNKKDESNKKDENNKNYSSASMVGKFKHLIMSRVKSNLAKAIKEQGINVLEIDEYTEDISERLRNEINITLEDYGLFMPEFFITSFLTPDDDKDFQRLKRQFAEKTLGVRDEEILKAKAEAAQGRKIVEAQTEAQLKMIQAQGEAEAKKIAAQAEAEAYKAQAYAEAEEMRAKGYTYQQETSRQVSLEAMKNGITGGGGVTGGLGDIAGLGVSLGAMGSVINMTKDAISPVLNTSGTIGNNIGVGIENTVKASENTWNCSCGQMNIMSKCCPECGAKKPDLPKAWNCKCGAVGITSNFCPECGAKKAEESWNCPNCGKTGIISKFCPDCGAKRE